MDHYEWIGRQHGYTPGQIEEYGMLIRLAAEWQANIFTSCDDGGWMEANDE